LIPWQPQLEKLLALRLLANAGFRAAGGP
jgi:hypothetical protein